MNEAAELFYTERDARTLQYGADLASLRRPVAVLIGADAAGDASSQVAAIGLVNMLARVHRRLHLDVPDAVLRARSLIGAGTLQDALVETALAINPFLDLTTARTGDTVPDGALTLAIGLSVPEGLDIYLRWELGRGEISPERGPTAPAFVEPPGQFSTHHDSRFGAATASCLAAAAAFRAVHGHRVRATRVNMFEFTADDRAGTTTTPGPVDVGNVLVIGAGAVSQALIYWLRELGVTGRWDIVDGDDAELHNTNRCMAMTAADAGWPDGRPGTEPKNKAFNAAALIDATPHPHWYDKWLALAAPTRYDLVLVLANERGVRASAAALGQPILLHATTSADWTAELHRHIPGRDDCPACRLPSSAKPRFACSNGPVEPGDPQSGDAALPFLSAAAGLMLAGALLQLPDEGELVVGRYNHWRLHLELRHRLWQKSIHSGKQCSHVLAPETRNALSSRAPGRWDVVDSEGAGSA